MRETKDRPGPRSVHLLAAAAVLACSCSTEVAHGLRESEANRILASLAEQGIAGEIASAGLRGEASFTVVVPASEGARARLALSRLEMPAEPQQGLAEVFDRSGLVPTPTEERARLVHAIQGELARTLQSVAGVVAARVHVSLPETSRGLLPAGPERPEASASVVIRHVGERCPLGEDQVRGIVAGAISELDPGRITVVAIRTDTASPVTTSLVPLGPFSVASASLGALRAWLAVSSTAVGLLGVAVVLLALRIRRLRRRLAKLESQL